MANPNWKKGVSGNPNGRPKKGETFTDLLNENYDKQELLQHMWDKAVEEGDFQAQKYLMDRWDGTPKQTIDAQVAQLPKLIRFDDYTDDTEDTTTDKQ